jgi:hypothetical protein
MHAWAVWGWLDRMWRAMRDTTFWAVVVAVILTALRRMGMTWLEEIAVTVVIGILSKVIKNPHAVGMSDAVLQHIRDDATTALDALNPSAPPPPGYTKAS